MIVSNETIYDHCEKCVCFDSCVWSKQMVVRMIFGERDN